jgi:UDP:flavonoid glycosyltransferase YjiC (YdhE family)
MSRLLFATFPVTGHINPGLPIARELVARGHEVRWYTTPRFRRAVEAAGAHYIPFRRARQIDETRLAEMFADRPAGGIRQLQFDIEHIFIDLTRGMVADIEDELAHGGEADVIVGDSSSVAARYVHEHNGIPWAVYGVSPLALPGPDVAPFGLGILPSSSLLGRLRNRGLQWMVDHVLFRAATKANDVLRRDLSLPRMRGSIFDFARPADLYLHGTVPSFEYPRRDLPRNLHFVGAAIPQPPPEWKPPAWWPELHSRRVVLVTQGTINNDYDQLVRPAIRALAKEDVLVVVTTGSRPPEDVGLELPANVRLERFIPYAELMPKVDALLTNGGYGTVQIALAHGVPVVAIGRTEEKPEICNRVTWAGVGIGMKSLAPGEERVRTAVLKVLNDPIYRARASAVAREMAGRDYARSSAHLIAQLAAEEEELEQIA